MPVTPPSVGAAVLVRSSARLTLRLVALQFFKTAYIPQLFAVQIEQGALRLGLVTQTFICFYNQFMEL